VSTVHLITENKRSHLFYTQLLALKQTRAGRDAYIKLATEFLKDERFVKDLTQLVLPFWRLSEYLYYYESMAGDLIKAKVKELFGATVNELVTDDRFKTDKINISDSFVVAAIVRPKQNNLRGDLMRARRLVFLIELLAKYEDDRFDAKMIRTILAASIMVPFELFPIPNDNAKPIDKNKDAFETRKKNIEKTKEKVTKLSEKIKANTAAITELSTALSRNFFEQRLVDTTENTDTSTATASTPNKSLTI
jgi:hypothetical protein